MSTLHGILAELGIALPETHPERVARASEWKVDERFAPAAGKDYELAYGKLRYGGAERHVVKRVRIAGDAPDAWIDLDTGKPLDHALLAHEVKAFREIS